MPKKKREPENPSGSLSLSPSLSLHPAAETRAGRIGIGGAGRYKWGGSPCPGGRRCGGALGDAIMPNKKKYNVNGDSGVRAQVRAVFCTLISFFYLKIHLFLSVPLFLFLLSLTFPLQITDFWS